MKLKSSCEPDFLARAAYAKCVSATDWVVAHVDGCVSVFQNCQLQSVCAHPGDAPTCLEIAQGTAVVGFSSKKVRSYNVSGGWLIGEVDLPFIPSGIMMDAYSMVVWPRIGISTIEVRRWPLVASQVTSHLRPVLRSTRDATIFADGYCRGSDWTAWPESEAVDAIYYNGFWYVVWRDRWALCAGDGTEEFGATAPFNIKFSGIIDADEMGIFILCDNGATINVRENNVQYVDAPSAASMVAWGGWALDADLRVWELVDSHEGLRFVHKSSLHATRSSKYMLSTEDVAAVAGQVVGTTTGHLIYADGTDAAVLPSPILRVDESGKAWSRSYVVEPGCTAQSLPSPQPPTCVPFSIVDWTENAQFAVILGDNFIWWARVTEQTSGGLVACKVPLNRDLIDIFRLEEAAAVAAVGTVPFSSCRSSDSTDEIRIAKLLAEYWHQARAYELLLSPSCRSLALLAISSLSVPPALSGLKERLIAAMDTGGDLATVALAVIIRIPSRGNEVVVRAAFGALPRVPKSVKESFVLAFAQVSPSVFAKLASVGDAAIAVGHGLLGNEIPMLISRAIPPRTRDARDLLTSLRQKFPRHVQFHRPRQRLLVLTSNAIVYDLASHHSHRAITLRAPSPIADALFDDDGDVCGTLSNGKEAKWRLHSGLGALFAGDSVDASF